MALICNRNDNIGKYKVDSIVFDGARCINYKAISDIGKVVFVKQYKDPVPRRGDYYRDFINYQLNLKKRLDKPEIKRMVCEPIEFFELDPTKSGKPNRVNYFQVFEFITEGQDLSHYLTSDSTTWAQRLTFAKILMFAISKFHEEKIVHCDLKPENIYLVQDASIRAGYRLKLIDFDFAFLSDLTPPWVETSEVGFGGTPGYYSPEHICVSNEKGLFPQTASDVFTCGLILYELLMKEGNPYNGADITYEKYDEYVFNYKAPRPHLIESIGNPSIDNEICDIVYACLNPDLGKRPSAKAVHDVLVKARIYTIEKTKIPSLPIVQKTNGSDVLILESKYDSFKTRVKKANFGYGNECRLFPNEGAYCSKEQFSILHEEDGWYILPLKAKNDTIINGKKIESKTKVFNGDILAVGDVSRNKIKHPLTIKLG